MYPWLSHVTQVSVNQTKPSLELGLSLRPYPYKFVRHALRLFEMLHITSSSSPVGSAIFSCIALVVISLVVLLILRYYLPLRTTPAFYLIPIFFALWLPTIVVILVPVDLASSAVTGDEESRGIWLPERVILVSWRISYWLTFALTWYDDLVHCIAVETNEYIQVYSSNPCRILRLWIPRTIRQVHVLGS